MYKLYKHYNSNRCIVVYKNLGWQIQLSSIKYLYKEAQDGWRLNPGELTYYKYICNFTSYEDFQQKHPELII